MDISVALRITAGVTGQQAVDQLRTSMERLGGVANTVKGAFGALAGVAAIGGFVHMVKGAIDAADHLNDLSQKTGIAVQDLDALGFAAEMNGTNLDAVSGALGKLGKNMAEAAGGSKEAIAVFRQFGISQAELKTNSISTTDALAKIADKIASMPDGWQKAAAAQAVFGKSAADIVPLLNAGGDAIRSAGAELDRLGGRMDGEMAASADEFNDNMSRLSRSTSALAMNLANTLLPGLNDIAVALLDSKGAAKDLAPVFQIIDLAVRGTAAAVIELIAGLRQLVVTASTAFQQLAAIATLDFSKFQQLGGDWTKRMLEIGGNANQAALKLLQGAAIFNQAGEQMVNRAEKTSKPAKTGGFDFGAGKESEFDKLKQQLQEQLTKTGELTKSEEVLRLLQTDRYKELTTQQRAALLNIAKQIDYSKAQAEVEKEADEARKRSSEQEAARRTADQTAINDMRRSKQQEIDLLALESQRANMTAREYDKLVEAKRHEFEVNQSVADMLPENAISYRQLADSMFAAKQASEDLNYAQSRTFEAGAKRALDGYLDSISNVANATETIMTNAFKGMEDALVQFAMTGKLSFKDLANSIISDMIRMTIRMMILKPLMGGFGGLFGGGGGGGATIPMQPGGGYEGGGYTGSGARSGGLDGKGGFMAMIHPQETIIDHAKGQSVGNNVVVNVNVESGGEQVKSNQGAGELGRLIAGAVKAELINQKRPGGLLAA